MHSSEQPDLSDRKFDRILLIKPSALGDVIHTVPVLAKLRQRYPDARIDWLLQPALAEWIGHHPALSNVLLFDRRKLGQPWKSPRALAGLAHLLRSIRRADYDLVIDLHGQFRSAFFMLISGCKTRVGFDRPRKAVWNSPRNLPPEAYVHGWTGAREGSWVAYNHRLRIPTLDAHAVDRYLWLGEIFGFDSGAPNFHVPIPPASYELLETHIAQRRWQGMPLIAISPGTTWETKHWTAEGFSAVARHFASRGYGVILIGAPSDRARCEAVAEACPDALNLCGKTKVSELAAVIHRSAVCITNDSGPMHLAIAVERPVVSLFGPTDPLWIGPYGREDYVVREPLPCSPCYLRKVRECPFGHRCMRDLSADRVIAKAEELLALGHAQTLECM